LTTAFLLEKGYPTVSIFDVKKRIKILFNIKFKRRSFSLEIKNNPKASKEKKLFLYIKSGKHKNNI